MHCSLPGSSVRGIYQARILEWVAVPFSRRSSQPRNQTRVSFIAGGFFTSWATREALDFTIWTFVSKVMSLLFNTLSRFVIAFLPRSNHLLNYKFMAVVTICPEPVSCSNQVSNCCFLTGMWVSQETGKIVWYSHVFKSFAVLWSTQSKTSV